MPDEKDTFAKNLQFYMSLNNKTQTDLISDLNINKSTISTWVNGAKMPRMGTIQTLADYFGIMKSDLIEKKPINDIRNGLSRERAAFYGKVLKLDDRQFRVVSEIVDSVLRERDE